MTDRFHDHAPGVVRAIVVDPDISIHASGRDAGDRSAARKFEDSRLEEAVGLAMALDLDIVGEMTV